MNVLVSRQIGRKLAVAITVSLAVSLGLLGAVAVRSLTRLTDERIRTEVASAVHLKAANIATFFSEHARIVTTMLANPQLREWFDGYDTYRRPLAGDDGYRLVTAAFDRVVKEEPAVISAFLSTESTGEYFKADGRVEREGYDPRTRWWWAEALEHDTLYVSRAGVDASSGAIAVTIQTPVRRADGRLLGVGGVDFLLDTVESQVEGLSYRGQGTALLLESEGRMISFPGLGLPVEEQIETTLSALDERADGCRGFAALEARMRAGEEAAAQVRYKGADHVVFFSPVRTSQPQMRWSLGLLVPEAQVAGPVRKATAASVAGVLAVIGVIGALMLAVTAAIVTRPVGRLVNRFRDVVEGTGDLTRRVEVSSDDEIGELARLFNAFLERIQADMATITRLADALALSSEGLNNLSQQIAGATEETSAQASVVSSAAEQVSGSVQAVATGTEEMGSSIREIARSAHRAAEVAAQAVDIARSTSDRFGELRGSSDRIGSVVKMIRAVAEQTNLLALNATIEAARAGDAGKGFAVVAGEVKELASQTSVATGEISESITAISSHTESAGGAIRQVTDIINQINEIQTVIASAVEQQTSTTAEISRSVAEAARGTGEIADSIASFATAARDTATDASTIQAAARELAATAEQLRSIVTRFRV